MKKYALVSILVSLIGGWTAAPAALGATRTLEITKGVLLDKTGFSLSFSLSGARVVIRHINDDDTVVKADITYNTPPQGKMREPKLLTTSVGNTFIAEFKSGMRVLPYTNSTIEKWDIAIGNYDVDTELKLVCKNASADLDLSASHIGNSNFAFFNLTGSGGAAELNFDGLYAAGDHNAQIVTTGMIQNITIPSDAGAQVVVLPFSLPIVVVPQDEWTRDFRLPFLQHYSTSDYNTQRTKINLGITSLGSFGMVVRDAQ